MPSTQYLTQLQQHFEQKTLTLKHGPLTYRECGNGPVVVLLHGISSGAASWLPIALPLAQQGHRVIAWDAPGYGGSAPISAAEPKATDYAKVLVDLLETLNVSSCTLMGHSLGAIMAAATVAQAPIGRISRLILLSPARCYGDAHQGQGLKVKQARLSLLAEQGVEGIAQSRASHLLTPQASAEQLAWVQWNMQRLQATGYQQAVMLLCAEDIFHYLPPQLTVSVAVGNGDTITPPASCQLIAQACQVPLQLISSAGHACYIENPSKVIAMI